MPRVAPWTCRTCGYELPPPRRGPRPPCPECGERWAPLAADTSISPAVGTARTRTRLLACMVFACWTVFGAAAARHPADLLPAWPLLAVGTIGMGAIAWCDCRQEHRPWTGLWAPASLLFSILLGLSVLGAFAGVLLA